MGHLALRPIEEIPVYAREFVLKLGDKTREAKEEEKLS